MLEADVRATTETPTLSPEPQVHAVVASEAESEFAMLQTFAKCQEILMADGAVDWNGGVSLDAMEMEMGIQTHLMSRYVQTQLRTGETTFTEGELMIDWIINYGPLLREVFFEHGIYDPIVIENELYNIGGELHNDED